MHLLAEPRLTDQQWWQWFCLLRQQFWRDQVGANVGYPSSRNAGLRLAPLMPDVPLSKETFGTEQHPQSQRGLLPDLPPVGRFK